MCNTAPALYALWCSCTRSIFARFVHTWRRALAASVSLPSTDDPDYTSLDAFRQRLLGAVGSYMIWMCEVLTFTRPRNPLGPGRGCHSPRCRQYLEHVLDRWRSPLREVPDERLETPEYPSRWRTRYCIDAMLEHAVMHPIRHAFQLDELINNR